MIENLETLKFEFQKVGSWGLDGVVLATQLMAAAKSIRTGSLRF